jgi:hypothetical protein
MLKEMGKIAGADSCAAKKVRISIGATNQIVVGFEFQQAEADGRTAWRAVAVKSPPLTPSPPSAQSVEKTVAGWSVRI